MQLYTSQLTRTDKIDLETNTYNFYETTSLYNYLRIIVLSL